jgi:hypothetical protein
VISWYPKLDTTFSISCREIVASSYSMVTLSEARLTLALRMPSVAESMEVILDAQDAHDIPPTGMIFFIRAIILCKFITILNNRIEKPVQFSGFFTFCFEPFFITVVSLRK